MCEIARISGDFVRRNFNKDVFPKLILCLRSHRSDSASKSSDSSLVFRHSTVFKFLRSIFTLLGPLLLHVKVGYEDLHVLMEASLPYLSSSSSEDLQTAAVTLFENLILVDCDAVWLFLSDVYAKESTIQPPSAKLPAIRVSGTNDISNEYAKNVSFLLDLCT